MNKCLQRLTLLADDCDDPLRYDFRNFLDFVFREILQFDPPSDLIFDVADYMQNLPMSEDDKGRGQVQCQRLAGKSVVVAIFVVWLFYCNPDIKVAIICSTHDFAKRTVKFIRSMFNGHPLLHHLAPRLAADNRLEDYRKDQLDNEDTFVCGARTKYDIDASCKAFGITSVFTGIHPDIVIPDDVEVPENSGTVQKREKMHEKCKEFESLCMPGGLIMFMGTPQTIESLYLKYLDRRYVLRRWPAQYPDLHDESQCKGVSPMLLDKLSCGEVQAGDPTYPERFNEKELEVIEDIEGHIMYSLQYLLDPTMADEDRFPLKLSDLIIMDVAHDMAPSRVAWGTTEPLGKMIDHAGLSTDGFFAPVFVDKDWVPYAKTVMYVDPSGRGKDEVAYAVVKGTQGMLFVAAVGGFKGDGTSSAVMDKLAKIAWEHEVQVIVVEDNFGDGMYTKLLAPAVGKVCRAHVTGKRSTGQKEKRIIDVLGPLSRQHRLVWAKRVARNLELTKQYTHITYDRGSIQHDDQVEALAGACAEFTDMIQVDPEKMDENRKRRQVEDLARDFQQSWLRQARSGRAVISGMNLSEADQQRLRGMLVPRRPGYKGTRGWTRV